MCCLFGYYNYSGHALKNASALTNALAREATVRGTDATGIAYNHNGKIIINKEPKSAFELKLNHPDKAISVMGHTRHSTQGNKKKNFNNHPFSGHCKNLNFALAHNGVLSNDYRLRKDLSLPKTRIETDSYIAVQLIEKKKVLNNESIKFMAEKVHGSFAFSILDSDDTLWLVRGDSPLTILHIPKLKVYIYASTPSILYKALADTALFDAVKNGETEEIDIQSGYIFNLLPDGTIAESKFDYKDYSYCSWWEYPQTATNSYSYIDDLKEIAKYYGYSSDAIDDLLDNGFTLEDIEEYIYCME